MTARYHTRVIAVVHSHVRRGDTNGTINLSPDVIAMSIQKSTKGAGGWSLSLVPRKNYLNYVFPNDVVNIYIDPGDGESGFVRTMMGYVDRVERTEQVSDDGRMSTQFRIVGTDITKAIDKTDIYQNPHLVERKDFEQVGIGAAGIESVMRQRGITVYGTPAQFVENLLSLILGFGKQWVMPQSYATTSTYVSAARSRRLQRFKNLLPNDVKNMWQSVFGTSIDKLTTDKSIEQLLTEKQADYKKAAKEFDGTAFGAVYTAQQANLSKIKSSQLALAAYQTVLRESKSTAAGSILDVMTLDFMEALATDGYLSSQGVWLQAGSLASTLYGFCNEIVNELIFDLRPVVSDGHGDDCFGTTYSKDSDELKINTDGFGQDFRPSVSAVQYRPAVVFREYPYSVIEGINLEDYTVLGKPVGKQAFGPVFALGVNKPGRKLYNYETVLGKGNSLNGNKCLYSSAGKSIKHLDVVVITDQDVTNSELGRSDNDTFNINSVFSTSLDVGLWRFALAEFMPMITPVSIGRHGVRAREETTRFANPDRHYLCGKGGSAVDTAVVRSQIVRWALLKDHWAQHNIEYLSGTITMRGRPDIRVGYRLDWADRHESYYVDQVSHEWAYPGALTTTVQVTRGQRNDPFPAYIPPAVAKDNQAFGKQTNFAQSTAFNERIVKANSAFAASGGGNRTESGRLADFFMVRDSNATVFAVGGDPKQTEENDIDKAGNADHGGIAAYTSQLINNSVTPAAVQLQQLAIPDKPEPTE